MAFDYAIQIKKLVPGKSISELSQRAGIGKNAVYRWNVSTPNVLSLAKLGNYMGVDYRLLLPDQEELLKQAAEQDARRKTKKNQQNEK